MSLTESESKELIDITNKLEAQLKLCLCDESLVERRNQLLKKHFNHEKQIKTNVV